MQKEEPIKTYDLKSIGIEETDSCPACKRQLKGLIQEHEGSFIATPAGEWICLNCGVAFVPQSRLKKIIEKMKEAQSPIIKPKLVIPTIQP